MLLARPEVYNSARSRTVKWCCIVGCSSDAVTTSYLGSKIVRAAKMIHNPIGTNMRPDRQSGSLKISQPSRITG